ncbi:MAG: RNA pseudouridine synthase [Myxococcota bacterium]
MFISKPPGLLSTVGRGQEGQPTVVSVLQAELGLREPPRLCHRLDQDTSGVMVLALDVAAQRAASAEFEHHRVRKTYVALCHGELRGTRVVDLPLGPDPHAPRHDRARQAVVEGGKPARTVVLSLWTDGQVSLVAARPSTGRAHQIRVHLSSVGHPLLGDTAYGGRDAPRPMLHAAFLALRALGRDRSAGAPLWEDLSARLRALGAPVPLPAEVDAQLTAAIRTAR